MQFSASRAFTEAFQLLGARFGMLVGIWLVFFVGIIAVIAAFGGVFFSMMQMSMGAGGGLTPGQNPLAGMGFSVFIFYILYFLVIFAQQIALSRASTGRPEDTFGIALGAGLRGALPLLGVLLIYFIAGIGGGFVIGLVFAGVIVATESAALSFVLGLLMLLAFFYLFARFSLVLPLVAIAEVRNPLAVIGRAWRLTAGNSVKIALTWALVLIAMTVLYFVVFMVTVGFPTPGTVPGPMSSIGFIIAMIVMGLSVGLYMVTLTTALYDQLSPSSVAETANTFA